MYELYVYVCLCTFLVCERKLMWVCDVYVSDCVPHVTIGRQLLLEKLIGPPLSGMEIV